MAVDGLVIEGERFVLWALGTLQLRWFFFKGGA